MTICNCCNVEFLQGPIHFAYDRKFCSHFCRNKCLNENQSISNKYNICWKDIPIAIESSKPVTKIPSMKSSISLQKGMDLNFNNFKNKECKNEESKNNINKSDEALNYDPSNLNYFDGSYISYTFKSCFSSRKVWILPSILISIFR